MLRLLIFCSFSMLFCTASDEENLSTEGSSDGTSQSEEHLEGEDRESPRREAHNPSNPLRFCKEIQYGYHSDSPKHSRTCDWLAEQLPTDDESIEFFRVVVSNRDERFVSYCRFCRDNLDKLVKEKSTNPSVLAARWEAIEGDLPVYGLCCLGGEHPAVTGHVCDFNPSDLTSPLLYQDERRILKFIATIGVRARYCHDCIGKLFEAIANDGDRFSDVVYMAALNRIAQNPKYFVTVTPKDFLEYLERLRTEDRERYSSIYSLDAINKKMVEFCSFMEKLLEQRSRRSITKKQMHKILRRLVEGELILQIDETLEVNQQMNPEPVERLKRLLSPGPVV